MAAGFTQRQASAEFGGSNFGSFAKGAADKTAQIFDEKRALKHQESMATYQSELDRNSKFLELTERENQIIRAEGRASNALTATNARKAEGLRSQIDTSASVFARRYGVKFTEQEMTKISTDMVKAGITSQTASATVKSFMDRAATAKILKDYGHLRPKDIADPNLRAVVAKLKARGGGITDMQEFDDKVSVAQAGNQSNPMKRIDPKIEELTNGQYSNAAQINKVLVDAWMKTNTAGQFPSYQNFLEERGMPLLESQLGARNAAELMKRLRGQSAPVTDPQVGADASAQVDHLLSPDNALALPEIIKNDPAALAGMMRSLRESGNIRKAKELADRIRAIRQQG